VVADKSNHQMVTHAKHAHQELSNTQPIQRLVLDQHAQDNTKSNSVLMSRTVEDAKNANTHNSCQTPPRLNVLKDHWPTATVLAEDQVLDINASHAKEVQFKILLIHSDVSNQFAMVNTKSQDQLMLHHAVNAKIANGQNSFQTMPELPVY
jgi:hypothetical protein